MTNEAYEYEVALSFAGKQRDYVRNVAEVLKTNGVNFYFDEYDEIEMWGKFMPDHFQKVMGDKSKYAVVFISKEYKENFYTNLERMTMLTSDLFKEERLLPARFDDTKLPGLPEGIKYISLSKLTPNQFAEKILQKIGRATNPQSSKSSSENFYIPKPKKTINPITERKEWIRYLVEEIGRRSEQVEGLEMDDDDEGPHHKLLFQYNRDTLFSIRIIKGGIGNDNGLAFGFDYGYSSGRGMNAWGEFKQSSKGVEIVLDVNGMGFNMHDGEYSKSKLVDALWKKVTDQVNERNKR